jgi:hypothetical protein
VAWFGGESGRSTGFTVAPEAAAMAARWRCAPAREGWWPAFIAKLKVVGSLLARQGSMSRHGQWVWPRYGGSAIGRAAQWVQPTRAREARGARG